jgi:hypothetical protein
MTQPTPTPPLTPRDWRAQTATTAALTLAYSGLAVEVGAVQLDQLLLAGKIPDLLTPLVAEALWEPVGQGKNTDELASQKGFYELVNCVVRAALVSPRVVDNPTADDEIGIEHLPFLDKVLIYRTATQPLGVLHRFRPVKDATVDALPKGEDVRTDAEPAPAPS